MGYKWEYEYTYSDFVEYVEKTPRHSEEHDSSDDPDFSFFQTHSFKEALDLAKYGWDSGIKELENTIKDISVQGNTEVEWNVAGGIVDVPKFLNAEPDCMIDFVDIVERDKPQLTIYVPVDYLAYIEGADALAHMKDVLQIIVEKMNTHDIRVYVTFLTELYDGNEKVEVLIKDFGQNIVLNSFAFALHPSFFRRLRFKFLETKPYCQGGYGGRPTLKIKELTDKKEKGEYMLIPSVQEGGKVDRKQIKTLTK